MGVATQLLVLSVVVLAASGAPEDNSAYCHAWCEDPPGSGLYECCDKVGAPKAECPVDRRSPGSCDNQEHSRQRCYANSDCPSGLLCCYDACLGQTCKNPSSGGAVPVSAPPPAVTQPTGIDAECPKESGEFALLHIQTGLYVQPLSNANEAHLKLESPLSDIGRFKVENDRASSTLLRHIKHISSGMYVWQSGGKSNPAKGVIPILYNGGATTLNLFSFNQATNIIRFQSGLYLNPQNLVPLKGSNLNLWSSSYNGQFKAVHYNDPNKEFLIYGPADVTASWQLVCNIDTPAIAKQTCTQTVQVGHSESLSSTYKTFAWQIAAKAQFWFEEMAFSEKKDGVAKEVRESSAETWSKSITRTITVTVEKGTIAVWQLYFKASQHEQFSTQESNIHAHTKNSSIKPGDDGAPRKICETERATDDLYITATERDVRCNLAPHT